MAIPVLAQTGSIMSYKALWVDKFVSVFLFLILLAKRKLLMELLLMECEGVGHICGVECSEGVFLPAKERSRFRPGRICVLLALY